MGFFHPISEPGGYPSPILATLLVWTACSMGCASKSVPVDTNKDPSAPDEDATPHTGSDGNEETDTHIATQNQPVSDRFREMGSDTAQEIVETACPYQCMASFMCRNAGGIEVAGGCASLIQVCCHPPEWEETTDGDTDTGTEEDAGNQTDTVGHRDTEWDAGSVGTDTISVSKAVFQAHGEISPDIGTVGIVTWSVNVPVDSAVIRFGPANGALDLTAPVDLDEGNHRTLLLGMKPDTAYEFVIVAEGAETYTSDPYELTTGPQRTGLPVWAITDHGGSPYRGFTIACTREIVYIVDQDGDPVWWREGVKECCRARMSYNGKEMWAGNANVVGTSGTLFRIAMDGSSLETYSRPDRHHDFAVLENNHLLLIERSEPGDIAGGGVGIGGRDPADIIRELDPDTGEVTDIYHQHDDFEVLVESEGAHTNAINFVPHLHGISFSILNLDTIAVVTYPQGELLHTYGGSLSEYDIMGWDSQHNHQVTESGLVLFNNNGSTGNGSSVLKYEINGDGATEVWEYAPGIASPTFGQATELPNGNVLVCYSNNNVIHELSPQRELVQEIKITDGGKGLGGYITRRATLYGPPPPWGE